MNNRIVIPSSFKDIKQTTHAVAGLLRDAGADEADIFDIKLSLEEAIINAIKYGNRLDKKRHVTIDVSITGDKATISIEDEGEGFNHKNLPDPTKEENLLKARGRGVFLIRHLMDSVEYSKKGNRVTLMKFLKKDRSNEQDAIGGERSSHAC